MERNRERGVFGPVFFTYMIGYALGSFIQGVVVDHDASEGQLREIQQYNQQIVGQLDDSYPDIEDLVLEKDKDFTFSISQDGEDKTCAGEYEVTQDTATAIGEIVCSFSEPVEPTTTTLR